MTVRVLYEVKSREDEYEFVKLISGRIEGLPPSAQLAQRERRLLAHGRLSRVHLDQSDVQSSLTHPPRDRRQREDSSDTSQIPLKPHETALHAFVFTDLLLFVSTFKGTRHDGSQRTAKDGELWKLLPDIGVSRLLSVSEKSGLHGESNSKHSFYSFRLTIFIGYDHLIGLDILPVPVHEVGTGNISGVSCSYIYLHVPEEGTEALVGTFPHVSRLKWKSAFERCLHFTLRSLSFPQSGDYLAPGADHQSDTRKSLLSILASGLPLPKSPSIQMQELHASKDPMHQEREERGWWTLRFQQVIRELYRQGFSL